MLLLRGIFQRVMASAGQGGRPAYRGALLEPLILRDQLVAVRRTILVAMPVNAVLGFIVTLVSIRYGHGTAGLAWFASSSASNLLRVVLCLAPLPVPGAPYVGLGRHAVSPVRRRLRLCSGAALISGFTWALIPALCAGYTTPQALFYLAVVCGTTAGAVTHGAAYARIPTCFITPVLLSVCVCLFHTGGFDRNCLGVTVLLYLAALVQVAHQSEAGFRQSSRLTNEATTLAHSLREAHARSIAVAQQMSHRATHDELTGLLNRAGFMQEVERRAAAADAPLCLMLLDLDGFKSVNDVYGHKAGDRVLAEVARRLREALTADFAIARIGGDEFAVFFTLTVPEAPPVLATRLITAIEVPFAAFDAGRLGVSIGLHVARDFDITEMLTCADEALYVAKAAGRNRYFLFDDGLRDRLEMRRDVERDLLRALMEQALEVWYQPVFSQDGAALVNLEALVRWRHPRHGWIPPPELVATAAIAGLSEPLLRFIFDDVCLMIRALRDLGLEHVWVAMNVSPREVSRIAVDELLLGRLREAGLPPAMLEIEITEETALDIRSVQDKLNRLSRAGVHIAIDDFGIGYSSLASLRHLHVNRIKIDRSFVTGIAASSGDQILVQAILKIGESLGIEVVAEGVETADDLRLLQGLGCRLIQGHHFKPARPRAEVVGWLQRQAGQVFSAES